MTTFNYRWLEYFSLKFYTRFPHINVYNMVFEIFLFCLDLELFAKITKDLIPKHSETRFVYIFIDNSRSKQNKKQRKEIPNILLYTSWSKKRVQNCSEKYQTLMVVSARQSFQFFRQVAWFLENKRALSKFRYRILHYLFSIIKL